jgi:hypothetical protein
MTASRACSGTLPAMSEDQSSAIPDSFLALHAGLRGRLITPMAALRARYELCEDLALQLQASAQALQHDDGLAPSDVLAGIRSALANPAAGMAEGESVWVVRRLAELLGWEDPGPT